MVWVRHVLAKLAGLQSRSSLARRLRIGAHQAALARRALPHWPRLRAGTSRSCVRGPRPALWQLGARGTQRAAPLTTTAAGISPGPRSPGRARSGLQTVRSWITCRPRLGASGGPASVLPILICR